MPHTLPVADQTTKQAATFDCSLRRSDHDVVCVHAAGELDIATAPQLELALREAMLQSRVVVLDLRDLAFIDSCGVHVIDKASNRARHLGRRLVVLRGPANITRMLALTSITDEFELARHGSHSPVPAAAPSGQRVVAHTASRGAT
jgi:anti-sigma B factor antagonist